MPAQLFLIAPSDADAATFVPQLKRVLEAAVVDALLLPRGNRAEGAYKSFVKAVVPVAQPAGAAVLIEGDPGLVRMLGADGLHVAGAVSEVAAAAAALRPDYIVGAGAIASRHDAMSKAEAGVDYVLFGATSGQLRPEQREIAHWWAETMEVPSVLADPSATAETANAEGCEFIGLGDSVWADPDGPDAALRRILRLEDAAP
jgi:thiamine-phosphate pyrophosphorylase